MPLLLLILDPPLHYDLSLNQKQCPLLYLVLLRDYLARLVLDHVHTARDFHHDPWFLGQPQRGQLDEGLEIEQQSRDDLQV